MVVYIIQFILNQHIPKSTIMRYLIFIPLSTSSTLSYFLSQPDNLQFKLRHVRKCFQVNSYRKQNIHKSSSISPSKDTSKKVCTFYSNQRMNFKVAPVIRKVCKWLLNNAFYQDNAPSHSYYVVMTTIQ